MDRRDALRCLLHVEPNAFDLKPDALDAGAVIGALTPQLLHLGLMAIEDAVTRPQQLLFQHCEERFDDLGRHLAGVIAYAEASVDERL